LIEDDESILKYETFLTEDSKIHYFGNHKDKAEDALEKSDGIPNIDKVWIYGEDSDRINTFERIYSNEAKSGVNGYILNASYKSGWVESGTTNPYADKGGTIDEVTNQIVNNKRLLITFNLHYNWQTKKGLEELKYLDDIVMNYLTQLIPSTTILQVEYVSK
jgi:hypothetical protein